MSGNANDQVAAEVNNTAQSGASDNRTPSVRSNRNIWVELVVAILIVSITIWCACRWYSQYQLVSAKANVEYRTTFDLREKSMLKPGPSTFKYDSQTKELIYVGSIDDGTKELLTKLLYSVSEKDQETTKPAFDAALDDLAYRSNKSKTDFTASLLFLMSLTAVLGVQLRTMSDFIGNACYKGDLDLSRWWPWYVLRPFMGFLIGAMLIVLVQEGLLQLASLHSRGIHWWIGIAFVAGFGTQDITGRLRQISKALFGVAEGSDTKVGKGTGT